MLSLPKSSVLGISVNVHDNYFEWLQHRMLSGIGTHVVTLNSEMVMQARKNEDLAKLIDRAELAVPDGAGVVLFLRSLNLDVSRCPGIELAESLVRSAIANQKKIFLIGGAPGVLELVQARWQESILDFNPQLIVGIQHGYFDSDAEQDLVSQLEVAQPDLVLVGLGVPRQEFWIAHQRSRSLSPNAVWIGVGGSFDIWAGTKSRAPKFWRENNLEWLYRLYQEPWRWRRMVSIPQFAWYATVQSIKRSLEKPAK
jgi:N-acetylglucosaminyldiphosphoundecaprenol N-acetyl-beta-D-mannosaminyltransferase